MPSRHQYHVLHDHLKRDIMKGRYSVGDVLPSEHELAAQYDIARSTVRNALASLQREGYIEKKRGKGSIVAAARRALGILNYEGFSASAGRSSVQTKSVEEPKVAAWPADFYFELDAATQASGCIRFSRVRMIDHDYVMWETSYLPNQNLPRFVQLYRTKQSFFGFLARQYHLEVTGMRQEIKAMAATATVAKHLKLKSGTPILVIHRQYSTNRQGLHMYSTLYCNTNKYAMSNETNKNH